MLFNTAFSTGRAGAGLTATPLELKGYAGPSAEMSVPMTVARVAVSPRVAETHSARASRHAAGSGRRDVSSRAPPGLASARAPRTTRWRAFAIASAVGSRVDRRSRSIDAETRDATEERSTERARRRTEAAVARVPGEAGVETDPKTETSDARAADPELVRLPSGDAVAPWWTHGSDLANVVDVRSAEEYVARMEEAKTTAAARAEPLLVCVEFLAGWCFACRSLHPKLTKIASEEFADVLFLRVRKDECPALCDAMGIEKLPYVHLVVCGGDRAETTDAFAVNLSAPKLRKLRAGLGTHARGEAAGRRQPAAWRKDTQTSRRIVRRMHA